MTIFMILYAIGIIAVFTWLAMTGAIRMIKNYSGDVNLQCSAIIALISDSICWPITVIGTIIMILILIHKQEES